ncbi:MAG: hypothetical protein OEQ39_14505 [Gammaproteobacteria bacterium]|nr:hypothetical protein [Gammaproteobacteria bacterium]MDH3464917.1 hypothetical protein [Gammaproteobacteria bacterium]
MKKTLFDELVTSIQEAGRIKRGDAKPSRQICDRDRNVTQTSPNLSNRVTLCHGSANQMRVSY